MQRLIQASLLSFAAGMGAGYLLFYDSGESEARSSGRAAIDSVPSPAAGGAESFAPTVPVVAERARVYQRVADAGVDELYAMALAAIRAVDLPGRGFELDAALTGLIEIDPDAALAFAREQNLDPARKLDIALAVLDALGYSEQAIEYLLAALPTLDRDEFRARALERLSSTDPERALAVALAGFNRGDPIASAFGLVSAASPPALMAIATAWTERDPDGALAAIDTIANTQARFVFARAVLDRIAQSDPEDVLAYVDTMQMPDPQKFGLTQAAISQLAARDPERALRYAETLGGQNGQVAMMMATREWAQSDPAAAIAYVEALPTGLVRQNLLQQIASAYGRSDPDAALAWARSMNAGQAQAYAAVLTGIAQSDPMRALDLALDESGTGLPRGMQMQALMSVIANAANVSTVPLRSLADRVLALENNQVRQSALQMLSQRWASTDMDAALDWLISNQESVAANVLTDVARQLGQQDPQAAALYTGRVRGELRSAWVSAVASGYAQSDPASARQWAQQFRGEPLYEAAVTEIIRFSAGTDPAGAAALWESTDFAAPAVDAQLVSTIAGSWAAQDWPAARNWVATLPPGEARDSALTGMIGVRQDVPDASVMSLFSNDERRQRAVLNVIIQTAQYDPARARAMIPQYLDDPSHRQQAEQMIDDIQTNRGALISRGFAPGVAIRGDVAPVITR